MNILVSQVFKRNSVRFWLIDGIDYMTGLLPEKYRWRTNIGLGEHDCLPGPFILPILLMRRGVMHVSTVLIRRADAP